MNWLVWRQHRKTFLVFTGLLVIFGLFAILTGNHFWHTYQQILNTCAQNPANPSCSDLGTSLFQGDGGIIDTVIATGYAAPVLVGLFLGSPLLAREYEEGTNKLVWTQSASRRKWLTAKLVWTLAFAALYGLAIAFLVTWWSRTFNALNQDRFDAGEFSIQGLMPFASATLFTAIGFTMGAWFRKTLVALAITLGVFALCAESFGQWIRHHYMTPISRTAPVGPRDAEVPPGAWVLSRNIIDKNGHIVNAYNSQNLPVSCWALIQQVKPSPNDRGGASVATPNSANDIDNCLNTAGFHQVVTYQPAYRYWDFQRIEAGIYLGMTVVAVGATYWLVLKRDA